MFETLEVLPRDAILGIMALFREDQYPGKIDLSVGVYQDENGNTPILECVRRGELRLLEAQQTKSYVAIAGNAVSGLRHKPPPVFIVRLGPH